MTRILRYLPIAALTMLLAACGDDSNVYHTTTYPVVRVDAEVQVEPADEGPTEGEPGEEPGGEPGEEPGGEPGEEPGGEPGEEPGGEPGEEPGEDPGEEPGGEPGEEPGEDPVIRQLRERIIADAPVQAGGSYRLNFIYFDSGSLTVRTSAQGETLTGGFEKKPGAAEIKFAFGENFHTVVASSYETQTGASATLFTVDITEEYQKQYPAFRITKALRMEYTSHGF